LCKIAMACAFDIHINTTIEVVDGSPCNSHVKIVSLVQTQKKILWQSILVKECL